MASNTSTTALLQNFQALCSGIRLWSGQHYTVDQAHGPTWYYSPTRCGQNVGHHCSRILRNRCNHNIMSGTKRPIIANIAGQTGIFTAAFRNTTPPSPSTSIKSFHFSLCFAYPSVLWFRSLSLGSWWSFLSRGDRFR